MDGDENERTRAHGARRPAAGQIRQVAQKFLGRGAHACPGMDAGRARPHTRPCVEAEVSIAPAGPQPRRTRAQLVVVYRAARGLTNGMATLYSLPLDRRARRGAEHGRDRRAQDWKLGVGSSCHSLTRRVSLSTHLAVSYCRLPPGDGRWGPLLSLDAVALAGIGMRGR